MTTPPSPPAPPPPPPTPAPGAAPDQVETHSFPCPSCGARLRFDASEGALSCQYCGHSEEVADKAGPWAQQHAIRELDFQAAVAEALDTAEMETTRVHRCQGCGASVEVDPDVRADSCPFCATPFVGAPDEDRHIKPRALIPFFVDDEAARAAMKTWLKSLWFAPSGLAEFARKGRKLRAIFVPHWTYDAASRTRYRGKRGTEYTVRVGKQHHRRVRWRPAQGTVHRAFDDILVPACDHLPDKMIEGIGPWELAELEPYRPEYLAGSRTEAYQVSLQEGLTRARTLMDRYIRRDVKFDIGGDRQQIDHMETQLSHVTFKHILLPVYVGVYRFEGQAYQVLINAQTGRVRGARPYSKWKIAGAVLLAAVALIAAGYGIAWLETNSPTPMR